MANDMQKWRPRRAVRTAGAVIAVTFTALTTLDIALGASGRLPVALAVVTALFGTGSAWAGISYLWRYRIALGDGTLTVTGLFRTHRVWTQDVTSTRHSKYGLVFDLYDGRRVISRGLEIGYFGPWLRDHTQSGEVADDMMVAAQLARERYPLAPVDAAAVRQYQRRRRADAAIRGAAGLGIHAAALLVAFAVISGTSDHAATSNQNALQVTQPAATVGECTQDPSIAGLELKSIPCTASHTAQVYAIVDSASGDSCDNSLTMSKLLPQYHSWGSLAVIDINDSPTTICLIVTPSITHSVVKGH